MTIETRDFGEIEIAVEKVIYFVRPIYGFETCTRFVLLGDEELGESIAWLQSVEQPWLCFTLFLSTVFPDYTPRLPEDMEQILNQDHVTIWNICTFPETGSPTANLKSPLFVDEGQGKAAQVILQDAYSVRHPLLLREEDSPC